MTKRADQSTGQGTDGDRDDGGHSRAGSLGRVEETELAQRDTDGPTPRAARCRRHSDNRRPPMRHSAAPPTRSRTAPAARESVPAGAVARAIPVVPNRTATPMTARTGPATGRLAGELAGEEKGAVVGVTLSNGTHSELPSRRSVITDDLWSSGRIG